MPGRLRSSQRTLFATLLSLQWLQSAPCSVLAAPPNSQNRPQIDFDALGSVAIAGSFDAIQLYDSQTSYIPPYNTSQPQASLVSVDHSGLAARLAGVNGQIYAIAQCSDEEVYVGGNFASLEDGTALANLAVYNTRSRSITSVQQGIDGSVYALACDTNDEKLYVGGRFTRPVGSGAEFKGGIAIWDLRAKSWTAPPFGGLPGDETVVRSLHVANSTSTSRSLLVGGDFSTYWLQSTSANNTVIVAAGTNGTIEMRPFNGTMNSNSTVTVPASLGSNLVPIALTSAELASSDSTRNPQYQDATSILCPAGEDGSDRSTWLARADTVGRITARLYTPLEVGGFRIGNTNVGGAGTATFSIVAIPNNEVLTLSYRSEPTSASSALSTCSTSCPLSHDTSISYEDFLISGSSNGTTTITGFEITLNTHYGTQAGLHLLQLLSAGSISYSIDTQNTGYGQGVCSTGPFPVYGRSSSTHVETSSIPWNHHDVPSTVVSGTGEGMICAPTPVNTDPEDSAVATWYPYIAQDGTYDISFFTPACSFDATCGQRGFVDVTVEIAGIGAAISQMTTVDQEVGFDTWNTIYTGVINPISQNQEVKVTMRLSSSRRAVLAADKGDKYYLIADKILVIAKETDGGGSTIVKVGSGANQVGTEVSTNRSIAYTSGHGVWEWPLDSTGNSSPTIDATSRSVQSLPLRSSATNFDNIGFALATGSSVSIILQSPDAAFTVIAGNFNYTTSALSAQSVLLVATGGLSKVPNGGLSGSVLSAAFSDGYLYIAGDFNSTADGRVTGLNGQARTQYASLAGIWEAIPGLSSDTPTSLVTPLGDDLLFAYNRHPISIWSATSASELVGSNSSTSGTFQVAQPALGGQSAYLAGDLQSLNQMTSSPLAMLSSNGLARSSIPFDEAATSSSTAAAGASPASQPASTSGALMSGLKNRLSRRQATSSALPVPSSLPLSGLSNLTDPVIMATGFWTNSSSKEEVTFIVGRFAVDSSDIRNVAVVHSDGSLQALPTSQAFGTMRQVLVNEDTLWLGGDSSDTAGAEVLYSYNLASRTLLPFALSPAGDAFVTSLLQRDGSQVVAGYFTSVAGVSCSSICEYNTATQSWTSYGEGLRGVVSSLVQADSQLFVGGTFIANNTSYYLNVWNYGTSSWSAVSSDVIPGPISTITADGDHSVFAAGSSAVSGNAFIVRWDGSSWSNVATNQSGDPDAATSKVQQMAVIPLTSGNDAANGIFASRDRALLVSGQLNLQNVGSVSSAIFDGSTWYPYLLTSSTSGGAGALAGMFYANNNRTWARNNHLAVGLVILISIAIALGIIFLCVLVALVITLSLRTEEQRSYPIPIVPPYDPKYATGTPSTSPLPYAAAFAAANQEKAKGKTSTGVLQTLGAATVALSAGHPQGASELDAAPMSRDRGQSNSSRPMTSSEDDSMYDHDDMEEGDDSLPLRGVRYSFDAEREEELSISAGEMVEILDETDEHWHIVRRIRDGRQGLVPSAFLT